jgi:hypothetical protein
VNISLGGEKGAHARAVLVPGHHAARAPRRSHAHLTQHVRRVHVRHPRGRQGARDLQVRRVASPRANAEPCARAGRRFCLAVANARADADIRNPLAPPGAPPRAPLASLDAPVPDPPRPAPAARPPQVRPQGPGLQVQVRRAPPPVAAPVRRFFPPRSATLFPTAVSEGYPVARPPPSRLRRAARPPRIASPGAATADPARPRASPLAPGCDRSRSARRARPGPVSGVRDTAV